MWSKEEREVKNMKATYILAFSLAAYQLVAGEFNLMLFAFGYTFFGMFFSILLNTIKESKKLEEAEKEEEKQLQLLKNNSTTYGRKDKEE